jgi:DNA-binding response OmpR family regulator
MNLSYVTWLPLFCGNVVILIIPNGANVVMNQQLFEILNEIDFHLQQISDLRIRERTIIQASISGEKFPVTLLKFDDSTQSVHWYGCQSIRLKGKSYRLIKTIWKSKYHRASISKIEHCVWSAGTPEHLFVERHAICTMINRLQQKLTENNFPYKIKTLRVKTKTKNGSKQLIKGWQLICAQRTQKKLTR